ncbi:PLP-dependent aminotransferase family protein [Asanoa sp. WMMD1127]|uniref:MocR-like pyridoxine biosynthesis transcription factor PdxR n=1 Tax=Asanoa sp. WMMD1127 TaxID=3016107 RepID=UPI0024173158|nr:PLP-dependent aminotransferase family protein [Asanoa sp. WMMD1127]MDG4821027.1 PLP-dependent aminotransferase family protein [Asanoa sp. WMMD1127]
MEALLDLDRSRPGLGDQLTAALRAAIADGRLAPGARLPSSRGLAADLRVSRGVVVGAYEQLVAEGRLLTQRGSGTTVAAPSGPPAAAAGAYVGAEPTHVGAFGGNLPVDLRPGQPDLAAFPRAAWRRAYERALAGATAADLGYAGAAGAPRLRATLADYLGRVRAARLTADDVVVTTGAAQAFALVAHHLRRAGADRFGVEEPGSPSIRAHMTAQGLRLVPIPVDGDGLDVDALRASDVPAVLVTPAHQYPTGVVLAPHRRAALIAWARETGGLIVEDDYDAEFRYDRDPVGCLQGLAPDVVAHLGSASKALAPALRLGWLCPPRHRRAAIHAAKEAADYGGPALEQLAFADLLATGGYDRHLRQARRAHRRRRDALVAALATHLAGCRVHGVAAGLHLVVELPPGTDDAALAAKAHAAGLGPVPLSATRLSPGGPPGLVIGYAGQSPDRITASIRRLSELV